jgi:hypothetical protein
MDKDKEEKTQRQEAPEVEENAGHLNPLPPRPRRSRIYEGRHGNRSITAVLVPLSQSTSLLESGSEYLSVSIIDRTLSQNEKDLVSTFLEKSVDEGLSVKAMESTLRDKIHYAASVVKETLD